MKWKKQGYGQVAVILAVNIIYSNKCYVHEKQNTGLYLVCFYQA